MNAAKLNWSTMGFVCALLCASCQSQPVTIVATPLKHGPNDSATATINYKDGQVAGADSSWPVHYALPKFPGSKVLITYVVDLGPARGTGQAQLETDETPQAVEAFYEKWLDNNGWKVVPGCEHKNLKKPYLATKYKGRMQVIIVASIPKAASEKDGEKSKTRIHIQVFDRGSAKNPAVPTERQRIISDCTGLKPDEAIAKYSEEVKKDPYCGELWFERGNEWIKKGEIVKALRDYEQASNCELDNETYLEAVKVTRERIASESKQSQ